ncbi:hypothetical protein [Actinoplanes sp. NPDC051494]|uniref:hypothetical protein n=1 Tax=Actinoplanes sp. NPDC051494 TaxID=3363907 RepID=UPI0037BA076A
MADELLDIARGDPRLAAAIEKMLSDLADNGSDLMREMARGILDGESLRHAATSSAYGDEVSAAFGDFWKRYQEMTPEKHTEFEEIGREHLAPRETE